MMAYLNGGTPADPAESLWDSPPPHLDDPVLPLTWSKDAGDCKSRSEEHNKWTLSDPPLIHLGSITNMYHESIFHKSWSSTGSLWYYCTDVTGNCIVTGSPRLSMTKQRAARGFVSLALQDSSLQFLLRVWLKIWMCEFKNLRYIGFLLCWF